MESGHLRADDTHNLERFINILDTPFGEVCKALGLDETEPAGFLEVENCIFMFDSEKGHVFSGAVIMGETYGFFGIRVGTNWLEAAGKLESQGFRQAGDLERFTKPGEDVSVSVYLYPDDCPDASLSTVKDYSICVRYGHTP
ncbi:MAG: hypothetical protein ACYTAO_11905 [Planctomycetota bacterium]